MKIFCIGRNYAEHARELNNDIPEDPVIFMKPKSALYTGQFPFFYPEFSNELHYEAELVLRVSKNGKYVQERHAGQYYNAVTVGIDFTARDIQREMKNKGLPWEKAKSWDSSAVVGEWLPVNSDFLKSTIQFSLKKNGEEVQKGNSETMIYSFNQIIAEISRYFSLNIGDLIYTGTPAGVGECVVGDVLTGYLGDKQMFELVVK